ncbi:DUF6049 family protein [Agromyces bauzanensis]|uniref:2-oxoglutarate dehydrogenase n=1 Tax=Agromyces bauzanensis TaxID=1308924 RepID=A0A917UTF8_9MICO|nr:DUF6049 family protein [Agromyces bauzanensis]GGJ84214.1 hypothetical protein GCM10011372_23130 [Agromyces bauzanensis]
MVAEVKPARRRADSPTPRSRRRGRAVVVGLAVAALAGIAAAPIAATAGVDPAGLQAMLGIGGGGAAGAGGASGAAKSRPPQSVDGEEAGLRVRVSPTISTSLTVSAPVTITVEIENATGEAVAPGRVRLVHAGAVIDDEAELDDWLAVGGGSGAGIGGAAVPLAEGESRGLSAGGTVLVPFTIAPELFADLAGSPIVGLGAELVVGDTVVATGTDAYPNADVPAGGSVAVALVAPVTVPVGGGPSGLIPATQLENWTGPTGVLTRQLDALAGRRVAIGLDPRILASIRVLGSSAPASAIAWLERLSGLANEIFPLAYADADLAVQSQVGLPGLLSPTSFEDAMDPADFTPTDGDGTDADADGVEPTEAAAEPSTPGAVPTTDDLLAWPYTRTDIAWPADDTVAPGDLAYLDAAGLTTALLAPTNAAPVDGPTSASATIDASTALVADAGLTEPLRAAAAAQTDAAWRAATGRVLSELALDAASARTTVLASFDRGAPARSDRVSALIDELEGSGWSTLAGLADAIGAPPVTRTLVDGVEADDRRANVSRMIAAEAEVVSFASVLADDRLLTAPTRRDLMSLLDVTWLDDPESWTSAVGDWLVDQREIIGSVSVVQSSPINVVSTETGVPTTIDNGLPYPVTVLVEVDPSNGRLIVEDRIEVTVEPESRSTVRVPVVAGVGNGDVSLVVSLTSPTGVPIGDSVTIPANVQADWEGLGATILATLVVLVFGIGIWRNIRRRRRARSDQAADATAEGAEVEASDTEASGTDADTETDAVAPTSDTDTETSDTQADTDAESGTRG